MEKELKNGYVILNNLTARDRNYQAFCICDECLKKKEFLREDVKKYREENRANNSEDK